MGSLILEALLIWCKDAISSLPTNRSRDEDKSIKEGSAAVTPHNKFNQLYKSNRFEVIMKAMRQQNDAEARRRKSYH